MNDPRRALRPVDGAPEEATFCGYCGTPATPEASAAVASRVCERCRLGLLLTSAASLAPEPGEPFLVIDEGLEVRALSARAEKLLAMTETDAVNRHVGDLLVPAETSAHAAASLPALLVQAARSGRGGDPPLEVALRPRGVFGVHYLARIGPCRPAPAALIVLGTEP